MVAKVFGQSDLSGMHDEENINQHSVVIPDSNFVIASLLIADPGDFMYSALGHAAIRLQCPTYNLDYCYTYESEFSSNRMLDFFAGNLKMGMFALTLDEYCESYKSEGRGITEYLFNLPIEVKQELWRVLDERLMEGAYLPYDYYHRGCAVSCVNNIEQALGNIAIQYDSMFLEQNYTVKELWKEYTQKAPWISFFLYFISGGNEVDLPQTRRERLIVPIVLAEEWQKATIDGRPLLASTPTILLEGEPKYFEGWFTPMLLAILLLLISIVNIFIKPSYITYFMLAIQTIVGIGMFYLIFISDLCCTTWNWLFVLFNPFPMLFWYWRKYWMLPYATLLSVWLIWMLCVPHMIIDVPHIIITLAYILIYIKPRLVNIVDCKIIK